MQPFVEFPPSAPFSIFSPVKTSFFMKNSRGLLTPLIQQSRLIIYTIIIIRNRVTAPPPNPCLLRLLFIEEDNIKKHYNGGKKMKRKWNMIVYECLSIAGFFLLMLFLW